MSSSRHNRASRDSEYHQTVIDKYIIITDDSHPQFIRREFYLTSADWAAFDSHQVSVVWLSRSQNLSIISVCFPPHWNCDEVSHAVDDAGGIKPVFTHSNGWPFNLRQLITCRRTRNGHLKTNGWTSSRIRCSRRTATASCCWLASRRRARSTLLISSTSQLRNNECP